MTMNVLMIFGGDHTDHSIAHPHTGEHVPSDLAFKFFSTQTVLAFFMGFGWAGITSTVNWKLPLWQALLIASAFGFFLMCFTYFLLSKVRKLNHASSVNLYASLGSTGKVYTNIPASSEGEGKVQVVVSGSLRIVKAVSAGDPIDSFAEIEVVGVKDKETLVVKKISEKKA
jgi:membrane protein implicated in regulation of membrane protease activity